MNKVDILDEREAPKRLSASAETFAKVRAGLNAVIFGQDEVIEQTLVTLLAGGHGLLIGVPGLAKTKLVDTLGIVMGLDTSRVQFTPDLMPADITGSEVMEESISGERAFRFIRGPVFTQLLMADEINRASPRTQSALLQAMQEKHVTVAGARHDLPRLFHVLATQNPLEQEGTYPLPEAQLDRFLLQIDVGYPNLEASHAAGHHHGRGKTPTRVRGPDDLLDAQTRRRIPVGEKVMESILSLVRASASAAISDNGGGQIAWGPGSPRQPGLDAGGARPRPAGRPLRASTDDVVALAGSCAHRMALNFSARAEGATTASVIERLCHALF